MNRSLNSMPILSAEHDKVKFLSLLSKKREELPVRILHWAVMDNHYHLILETVDNRNLSSLAAAIQQGFSQYFHKKRQAEGLKSSGPIWGGRFKSILVERESYLLACGRYVERNPVRASLVGVPWEYPWSSAAAYAKGPGKDVPFSHLADVGFHSLYAALEETREGRQAAWRRFLLDEGAAKNDESLFRGCGKAVGGERFLHRLLMKGGRPSAAHQGMSVSKGKYKGTSGVKT